jgi:hypothetical protein
VRLVWFEGCTVIIDKTVFILGAGSSCDYGYPTGEELIKKITEIASRLSTYCDNRLKSGKVVQIVPKYVEGKWDQKLGTRGAMAAWEEVRTECQDLILRLKTVRPFVIDYFLAWNESVSDIGKLMIAAAILSVNHTRCRDTDVVTMLTKIGIDF